MKYDAVIVGAGPAGLKCAEILAKNGKEVGVFEKNKVIGKKVCAGGLTIKDLNVGIPEDIYQREFNRIVIRSPKNQILIEEDKPLIITVNRKDLGKWMKEKAEDAGADIHTNTMVTKVQDKCITIGNREKVNYKYLIGGDGSNSIVRKHLNLKTKNFAEVFQYETNKKFKDLEILLEPDRFGAYYAYIFPHKNLTYVGTGADLSKNIKQPVFGMSTKEIRLNFDSWCRERFDIKKAQFQAAIINYDYKGFDFGKIFLTGDAAGLASGATGEGIYNAMASGEEVAKKIIDSKFPCDKIHQILKIKRIEETFFRTMELNKTLTKLEIEFMVNLVKLKWFKHGAEDILIKK